MPTETELMKQSKFVFKGTIQKLKAGTMPVIPRTEDMAVVSVDEVFHAPEALGDWTGREITVQLAETQGVAEGQQAVFYTNGWLYGDSLAVREVGRWRVTPMTSSRVPGKTARVAQRMADEELRSHIAKADLVVVGRVTDVRPVVPTTDAKPREHDPQWWKATIEVEAVDKGVARAGPLTILFPHSIDVQWAHIPKCHEGQEGVWILRTGQVEEVDPALGAILTPLDFHGKEHVERVQAFVASKGSPGNP